MGKIHTYEQNPTMSRIQLWVVPKWAGSSNEQDPTMSRIKLWEGSNYEQDPTTVWAGSNSEQDPTMSRIQL